MVQPPANLQGKDILDLQGGNTFRVIVAGDAPNLPALAVNAQPTIAGTAQVNQTLTATPAVFSDSSATVTHQWLANGTPVPGATGTTLPLTAAQLGKTITYVSTATRVADGAVLASNASNALGPVAAVPVPTPPIKGAVKKPTFKASKVPTSKKKGKATVTVAAPSGLAKATGKVRITLKKGGTTKTINATLSGGKRSITLPKLKKGTWKVTVAYNGDANYNKATSKSYKLKIKK